MNRLDRSVAAATLSSIMLELSKFKLTIPAGKERRTPSDITSKICVVCDNIRTAHPKLDREVTALEDNMWMTTDAIRYVMSLQMALEKAGVC